MVAAAILSVLATDDTVTVIPDPDTVSPGFIGFSVMFVLAIATLLLIRSMVGHLRKVRYSPEPDPGAPDAVGTDPAALRPPG